MTINCIIETFICFNKVPRYIKIRNISEKITYIFRKRLKIASWCTVQFVANLLNGRVANMQFISLNDGHKMPIIGIGTWQAGRQEVEDSITTALQAGCRHIDTAFNYNNEEIIGIALKKWFDSGVGNREDIFITTKLPSIGNRPKDVPRFLQLSLERLQLSYIDLYLVHMPFGFICDDSTLTPAKKANGDLQIDYKTDHIATWKVLEELVNDGLIRSIGLANFNASQLQHVYEKAIIKPAVIQIELHAHLQQKELRQICKDLSIAITAFSPLGSPGAKSHFQNKYNYTIDKFPDILNHEKVVEIAQKYNKTPAQILLRHLTQQNIIVIPKSTNPTRIKQNLTIFDFDLTENDVSQLNDLDRGEKGRIINFLFFRGIEEHPEYPFPRNSTENSE